MAPQKPTKENESSLKISGDKSLNKDSGAPILNAAQQAFNVWIEKIERLREAIRGERAKYDALLQTAHKYLIPAYMQLAKAKIAVALALERAVLTDEYGKRQQQEIGLCIVGLCKQAFAISDPTTEAQALFDRWATQDTFIASESTKPNLKEILASELADVLGGNEDWDAWQDDPEKLQRMMDALEEKREQDAENARNQGKSQSRPPKTNSKEAKLKAAEVLKSRSVRTIYIALAKLMHPDMEPDMDLRAAKEEQMKLLIQAYERNDIAALLTMEMEWIHQQNNRLGSVPTDKLNLYVEVLKDQAKDLEGEKADLFWEPRYGLIREFAQGKLEKGNQKIKEEATYFQAVAKELHSMAKAFGEPDGRRRIGSFLKDFLA